METAEILSKSKYFAKTGRLILALLDNIFKIFTYQPWNKQKLMNRHGLAIETLHLANVTDFWNSLYRSGP